MKVAIVGSRKWKDLEQVREAVRALDPGTVVISGGAPGVDQVAENEARQRGMEVVTIRPKDPKSPSSYITRNHDIVWMADSVIAFYDGTSTGTASVIRFARNASKPLRVVTQ